MAIDLTYYRTNERGVAERRMLDHLDRISQRTGPLRELVVDPKWNEYANKLAEWVAQADGLIAQTRDTLLDPSTVSHDVLMALKLKLAMEQGKKEAWEEAMALPAVLGARLEELQNMVHDTIDKRS